jgi:DNA polymerase III alpha subunit
MKLEDIPLDDKKTWNAFKNCNTVGVFQFGSPVAMPVLKKMQCENMEELSAANSLIRPGTGGLDDYVKGKKNPNSIKKLDPRLDKHLVATYGTIVFQEQIMGLIAELMGITFGQADIYRRALEKMHKPANKKKVEYFNNNVIAIAIARGFKQEEAEFIRKMILDNCGYAFNKSHAVCYSYISYYTAWFKVNYPLIFHKTMLNGNLDNLSEYIDMARGDNIELLLPHINYSQFKTAIEDETSKSLRIGFNTINGVGEKAVESIVANRPYVTINDYFEKNDSKGKNKKVVESLINAGAFDGMPLEVEDNVISNLKTLGFIVQDKYVYLNRKQILEWHKTYIEMGAIKSVPNYEVSVSKIKNKYFDKYELTTEKDNNIIIPETLLSLFELAIDDGIKSRKKPKGQLKEMVESEKIQADPYTKPFIQSGEEISKLEINKLKLYLEDVDKNEFSFLPHPLARFTNKITNFKEAKDEDECIEAGIIVGMTERLTQTGKKYYWLMIRTPRETIRVTLWSNSYKKYKNLIKQFGLVAIRGKKGYGGMSCDDIKVVTPEK